MSEQEQKLPNQQDMAKASLSAKKALYEAISSNLGEMLSSDRLNVLQKGAAIKELAEAYRLVGGGTH